MKVLFATDGSESAARAQNLVARIAWPTPTTIKVLYVDQPFAGDLDLPRGQITAAHEQARTDVERELAATREALSAPGREVETTLKIGRPASTIVDAARAMPADLLVLGSHGRGALAAAVLGSVTAEVVDYAPSPVLVARGDTVTGVVLAHDGSPGAHFAETVLLSLPFLRQLPIRVLSTWIVAPGYGAMDPTGGSFIDGELYTQALREARDQAKAVADAAVARLQAAGVHAVAEVLEARAADGIASAAGTTDLIVMGTRGHTGLKRLLLGSVARGVLHRAHSSVLFVPQASRVP